MDSLPPYHIYPCGDHALTIGFGNIIDEGINRHVHQLFYRINQKNIAGVKDIIPAYSSITVVYDVIAVRKAFTAQTAFTTMCKILGEVMEEGTEEAVIEGACITQIPVCYESDFAPDLHEIAAVKNMRPEDIARLHCGKIYRVFMLGFLPGFAYMGSVDEKLVMPRRHVPRTKVAAGSVGIAGRQTGIYPLESPGGWNIIGQTPLRMFDAGRQQPALLKPGNSVEFYAVTADEFMAIKAAQWA